MSYQRALNVVNAVAALSGGSFLVIWWVYGEQWYLGPRLREHPGAGGVASVAGALWVLANLWQLWREFRVDDVAAFVRVRNADGEIAVSVRAIETSLARTVAGLNELQEVRVELHQADPAVASAGKDAVGKGLTVRATCGTWEGLNVTETYERLQAMLKARWREIVPGDRQPAFDVRLVTIARKQELPPERPRPKDAQTPYTRPRYLD